MAAAATQFQAADVTAAVNAVEAAVADELPFAQRIMAAAEAAAGPSAAKSPAAIADKLLCGLLPQYLVQVRANLQFLYTNGVVEGTPAAADAHAALTAALEKVEQAEELLQAWLQSPEDKEAAMSEWYDGMQNTVPWKGGTATLYTIIHEAGSQFKPFARTPAAEVPEAVLAVCLDGARAIIQADHTLIAMLDMPAIVNHPQFTAHMACEHLAWWSKMNRSMQKWMYAGAMEHVAQNPAALMAQNVGPLDDGALAGAAQQMTVMLQDGDALQTLMGGMMEMMQATGMMEGEDAREAIQESVAVGMETLKGMSPEDMQSLFQSVIAQQAGPSS